MRILFKEIEIDVRFHESICFDCLSHDIINAIHNIKKSFGATVNLLKVQDKQVTLSADPNIC